MSNVPEVPQGEVPVVNSPLTPVMEAILAIVASIATLAVGYGLVDNDNAQLAITAAGVILPAAWVIAGSINRKSRADVKAAAIEQGAPVRYETHA